MSVASLVKKNNKKKGVLSRMKRPILIPDLKIHAGVNGTLQGIFPTINKGYSASDIVRNEKQHSDIPLDIRGVRKVSFHQNVLNKIVERNEVLLNNKLHENKIIRGYSIRKVPVFEKNVLEYILRHNNLSSLVIELEEAFEDTKVLYN